MKEKGFTLVELLGVIVILSIIMLIAIPNITSMLEKSKYDQYIGDAKKLVSITEYEIRKGTINKPATGELIKVTLDYLSTSDVEKDPNGEEYDVNKSYVVIVRKEGYLYYYVNLVSTSGKGISLVDVNELSGDNRYKKVKKSNSVLTAAQIKQITGVNGTIIEVD